MPSLAINSTINCCSSRDPPSPDGLAPRLSTSPTRSPPKASTRVSKDAIPSVSSIKTLELREIFSVDEEDNVEDSFQSRVNGNSKLKAILEGDEFNSDNGRFEQVRPKKTTSNLNLKAVTQILKKHLSRESALNKRHSRSSVGTTDEEIERRAELRRIRQKRIQEELSNESNYDDDAKALSSVVDASSPSDMNVDSSWVPGTPLSLPTLKPPTLPLPKLPLPKLPLPKLPFLKLTSLDQQENPLLGFTQTPNLQSYATNSSNTMADSSCIVSRRHSSPVLSDFDMSFADPRVYVPLRKRSSPSTVAPTPRAPSIVVPKKSSWRLSFVSDNRGQHLRKLSREHTIPIALDSDHLRSNGQPPRRWLHAQGLRSSSQAVASSEESTNLESLASHSQTCSVNQEFGGVDGPQDDSKSVHLHKMEISKQLASKGLQSSSSSPQLSSWGSHQRGASNGSGVSQVIRNDRSRNLRKTSDSIPLSERIPQSWGTIVPSGTTALYSSLGSSIQPSPQSSRFNLMSLVIGSGSRSRVDLAEILTQGTTSPMPSPNRLETVNVSTTSLTIPITSHPRQLTMDETSVLASETESFREREVELRVVQARFASLDRVPNTPKSSRFREEFDFESPNEEKAPEPKIKKQSTFAKLAKLAIRSYDGPSGMEDLLGVPIPNNFKPGLRAPGSPLSDDSEAGEIWGKVVRKTADKNASDVKASSLKRSRQDSRKLSIIGGGLRRLSGRKSSKNDNIVDDHESAAAEYQQKFQERMAAKDLVMNDWEAELAATANKAKAKSRAIIKKTKAQTGPDRRFPASWARFPSHTRNERSSSATRTDKVGSHDFAMRTTGTGDKVFHKCIEIGDLHLHEDDEEWQAYSSKEMGFRERIGDRISQRMYKIETSGGGGAAFDFQTGGRRGSMMVANKLEFPELEILPVRPVVIEEELTQVIEDQENEVREQRKRITKMIASYDKVGRGDGSADLDYQDELDVPPPEEQNEPITSRTGMAAIGSQNQHGVDNSPLDGELEIGEKPIYIKAERDTITERSILYRRLDSNTDFDDQGQFDDVPLEDLRMSIADPRFYDDCVIVPVSDNIDDSHFEAVQTKSSRKEKFKTWHGKDWNGYRQSSRSRNMSLGMLTLRKSTDDYHHELQKMEELEKERVLKAIEDAFGKGV